MKQDTPEERMLVQRFAEGDGNAFREIYDRYAEALALFANTYTSNVEDATDITQNSFEVLWLRRAQFTSLFGIRGFLWQNTRFACLNYLDRKQVVRRSEKELSHRPQSEEPAFEKYDMQVKIFSELVRQVRALPPARREVFELAFFNRLSDEEIAERLKIAQATVRSHKRMALDVLREKMGPYKFEAALAFILLAAEQTMQVREAMQLR